MARVSIPGYTIERELGSGGMAKVYLAVQHSLERKVALKVMSPILAADESFSKRFLREARTIAGLTHPNIVAIYEVGVTVDNLHFFAMQHLPGGDFAERMRAGVSESELRRVLAGISKALGFAHERGFVHRDVTPANILFDPTGNPVLTDFGIARAVGGSTRITHTGVSIGTSIYMSPEQARGAEVDARSDLYSLGVLCYEALTGEVPFKGADSFAVAYAHVFEPIPRLPAERAHWQPLIDRALAKDARDRFASAEEMCGALLATGDAADSAATQKMAVLTGSGGNSKDLVRPAAVTQLVQAVGDRMKRRQELPEGALKRYGIAALAIIAVLAMGYGAYHQWRQPGQTDPAVVQDSPSMPAAVTQTVAPTSAPVSITGDPDEDPLHSSGVADMLAAAGYPAVIGEEEQQRSTLGPRSRTSQLATWLAAGELATRELRLQTPAGTSAVDFYGLVLAEDGANEAASSGLASVIDKYLELAAREHAEQKLDEARSMLERARQVAEIHPQPAPQRQRVSETQTAWVGAMIERAEAALAGWDRNGALAALDLASRLAPEDPRIGKLRSQAERFAQAGYRFQDRVRDGSLAPPMIVVALREVELLGASGSRRATLTTPFAVSQHEITRGEFSRFVQASGRSIGGSCRNREGTGLFGATKSSRDWRNPDIRQTDDHPVVCVDFEDAQAYTRWLSQETGHVYRLLSEAEWQALVAAVPSDGLCAVANLADRNLGGRNAFACDDGVEATAPVGRYAAANGVHDLDGNVREWVQDCANASHAGHPGTQAARLSGDCSERMAMGRAWHSDKDESTPRQRKAFKSNVRSNTIGFRVAMTLPQGPPG